MPQYEITPWDKSPLHPLTTANSHEDAAEQYATQCFGPSAWCAYTSKEPLDKRTGDRYFQAYRQAQVQGPRNRILEMPDDQYKFFVRRQ